MNSFVKKTSLALLSMIALTSCGKGKENTSDSSTSSSSQNILDFVAVVPSSKTWDADVSIGEHKYKFAVALKKDATVDFKGTCTGKAEKGRGGPGGGFGGPGGGFPGVGQGETEVSSIPAEPEETDFTKYNFSYTGNWVLEEGYGYTITLNDAANSIIHTDFEIYQGRQQFYYNVTTSEGASTTLFQAEDSSFRNSLASDYKTWDERDSQYIFEGEATGNNGSAATAYLYAHKDKSLVLNKPNGSTRAVTMGLKWDIENNNFVLIDGDKKYAADVSVNTEKTGYRLSYNSTTFFCSTSASVKSSALTNEDFDGKTLYQFTGSYRMEGPNGGNKNVALNLTNSDNKMYLYTDNNLIKKGTYTFADDKFTLTFEGEEPVEITKNADGNYVYSFQIKISSFFGESTIDVALTYTPRA